MSQHDTFLAAQTMPPADSEYDSILGAVMETARGRWFLHEYVRRNRETDTGSLLAAIERIEALLKSKAEEQPEVERSPLPQAAGLAASVESFAASVRSSSEEIREIADCLLESGAPRFLCNDLTSRVGALARACTEFQGTADEIRTFVNAVPENAAPANVAPEATEQAVTERENEAVTAILAAPVAQPITLPAPDHGPYADIMALSQDEKIALFT